MNLEGEGRDERRVGEISVAKRSLGKYCAGHKGISGPNGNLRTTKS
jgi:hypothetical protein